VTTVAEQQVHKVVFHVQSSCDAEPRARLQRDMPA
jgi:hypothetical protein